MARPLLVFVHGWSVTSTATYGALPARLKREASRRGGPGLDVAHVYLGQYVSFRDEVRVPDIAKAFDHAIREVLATAGPDRRFACITHSTGGPVVREWLDRQYVRAGRLDQCPLSHLVMLAPANFGSALARLGKGRLAGIRAWFDGVEPGTGVLDWLELASPESLALNLRWINEYPALRLADGPRPVFPFVLSGDAIDRKLYDHVNAYTGETGSDGVVRLAAANLNARHVVLEQPSPVTGEALPSARKRLRTLQVAANRRSPRVPFRILPGLSHSGEDMGVMASVPDGDRPHPTVDAILRCLAVSDARAHMALADEFDAENQRHQQPERRLEVEKIPVLPDRRYFHDPHAMVIFRLLDEAGTPLDDIDLLLTAGPQADPNQLPQGFLTDRQGHRRVPGHLALYFNHAALAGCPPIPDGKGGIARPALVPRPPYGLTLQPRGREKLVEHWAAALGGGLDDLLEVINPNQTTVVDIVLQRIVREGVFRFTRGLAPRDFRDDAAGGAL